MSSASQSVGGASNFGGKLEPAQWGLLLRLQRRKCLTPCSAVQVITKLLYLLSQGETFSKVRACYLLRLFPLPPLLMLKTRFLPRRAARIRHRVVADTIVSPLTKELGILIHLARTTSLSEDAFKFHIINL